MAQIYTIPSDVAFLDALAQGLWHNAGQDVFRLAETLILLPTRRACRPLREAFLRCMGTDAALLPRMQPLGDLDEDELYFAADLHTDIPPAITPLRRQLLLTQLIGKKEPNMPLDQAAQLAEALAQFLDAVQIEQCDMRQLGQLVPEKDMAEHWQQTVTFLDILTQAWPLMLAEEGCIDPADRRNRVLAAQARAWRDKPPQHPVIAAGSTGTMPATAELLSVIASLPQGAVIFPGLDQQLDEEAWQVIDETHPQFGMKHFLEQSGVKRHSVKEWFRKDMLTSPARLQLLHESTRPAAVTESWKNLRPIDVPVDALTGLTRIELDHVQEEAQTIALLMRQSLESPTKTTALVTADRSLAERVSAVLQRWGIVANDSAGTSLATQPIGAFLCDVLAAAAPQASSIDFLSLLKHPLAAWGLSLVECRARARQMEMDIWRNPRSGLDPNSAAHRDLSKLKRDLSSLTQNWYDKRPLQERLQTHIRLAEALSTSDQETGANRLWQGDAGEAATTWFDEAQKAAVAFPPVTGAEYAGLFKTFLRAVTIRPRYGQHPRLSILGPLEARMIRTDRIILGGLNEGSWPPESPVDPWMSRPMKKSFKLPSPERRVGLSAHDFVQLACADEVFLTRAKRAGNAPTVPSRFLLQLDTVLRALKYSNDKKDALKSPEPWQAWARQLDKPETITPCSAPEPKPPVAARPLQLSVTEIGTWRRNPYAIYAKHVLKLIKLDPLEAEIDASDRGTMIHAALDQFIKTHPKALPDQALNELLKMGRAVFASYDEHPEVKAFWWPRFERIAGWFIEHETELRAQGIYPLQAEAKGHTMFGPFTLKGRADRIDSLPDGNLSIIDYKTGGVPSLADVKAGYEPQLPLLALIAVRGGFENVAVTDVAELAYWKLNGGRDIAELAPVKADISNLMSAAAEGLHELIAQFNDSATPYLAAPKPRWQPHFDDYAHLARMAEWGRTEGGE